MEATTHLTRLITTVAVAVLLAGMLLAATIGTAWASEGRAIGDSLVSIEADDGAADGFVYLRNSNDPGIG